MGDFLIWALIVALSFAKLILFAVLIIAVWVWIKKHSPETTDKITNKYNNLKERS